MTKQTEISHDTQSVPRIYSRLKPQRDVWTFWRVCVWLHEELSYLARAHFRPLF